MAKHKDEFAGTRQHKRTVVNHVIIIKNGVYWVGTEAKYLGNDSDIYYKICDNLLMNGFEYQVDAESYLASMEEKLV